MKNEHASTGTDTRAAADTGTGTTASTAASAGGWSRRHALRRTAGLGLGAAVVWLSAGAARAQGKLAKEAVKYADRSDVPGKDCDDCQQFLPPASPKDAAGCRIVDGPISPHGHCIASPPRTR